LAKQKKVSRLPGRVPADSLKSTATHKAKAQRPHPNPLPEGEGARQGPHCASHPRQLPHLPLHTPTERHS
jgi:hypothetical protein